MSRARRRAAGDWRPRHARIAEIVEDLAERAGGRVVLRDPARTFTGRELHWEVVQLSVALARLGLRRGMRVVVVGENGAALACALFAVTARDAWVAPVNARLTPVEITAIVEHADPAFVLFCTDTSPEAAEHARRFGADPVELGRFGIHLLDRGVRGAEPGHPAPEEQVAALMYTSGTTGRPKGVMLTHANLLFVAEHSAGLRGVSPQDTVYAVLPITHIFGLASVFLGALFHGAEVRLVPRFSAEAAARAIEEEGITVFQGVPVMFQRLLEFADTRGRPLRPQSLRYISSGGAPLDVGLKRRVEAALGLPLHNGYGLTEASPTTHMTRPEEPADDDTVGPPLPHVEQRIVEPASGRVLPPGEVGELQVRGPGVMKGYFRDPDETARVLLPGGWLRTGDLGRIDRRGWLYVVGRLRELIVRSGFNVYPPEVEAVLQQHPAVAVAAVIGRPVAGNEEVVAVIEPVRGARLDLDELRAFAAERLAPYKRPQHWIVVDELPKTPAGKVLKAQLRHLVEGRAA